MNLETLKQALADILNPDIDYEAEPELLKYFHDVLAKLNHPDTISSDVLVTFFTQLQLILFQQENEYIDIIFDTKEYRIQSLFNSLLIIEIEIEKTLLKPLDIRPLRKLSFTQFHVVNCGNKIKSQTKTFSPIAVSV